MTVVAMVWYGGLRVTAELGVQRSVRCGVRGVLTVRRRLLLYPSERLFVLLPFQAAMTTGQPALASNRVPKCASFAVIKGG